MKLISTLALLIFPLGAAAEGIDLTVSGVRSDVGQALVAVFDSAQAFDRLDFEKVAGFAALPAQRGSLAHHFTGLNAGPYAIFLFHDENSDEDLNVRGWTLLEGIGASGADAPGDEPSFAEAAFAPGPVTVKLHYGQ